MSDRYARFYTLKKSDYLHTDGCPITCIAGSLLLDKQEERIVGQLKFRNTSDMNVVSASVCIKAFDENNSEIAGIDDFIYSNINVGLGEEFGGNRAIVFPDDETRRITIEIKKVVRENGEIWDNDSIAQHNSAEMVPVVSNSLAEHSGKLKRLTCDLCGSNDLVKKDGVFVCQYCETRYTVEEARRMIIQGNLDVSGSTVKVDNSDFVKKCLANARRAKKKEDWEETEKYYNLVEQNDPTNIEAIFYSAYGKAKTSLTDSNIYKRQAVFKVLQNCVSIIDDNYTIEDEEEVKTIIEQITTDIISMASSEYVYNEWKNGNNVTQSDSSKTRALFISLLEEYKLSLKNIIKKYEVNDRSRVKYIYYLIIKLYEFQRDHMYHTAQDKNFCNQRIIEIHTEIKEFEPDHEIPVFDVISNGCYIATAVYGSYDCPEVWTLRRYRDYTLNKTWYGRAFIRAYYAISPTLVRWFGHTEWFKTGWKKYLDIIITKLKAEGFEDTPYADKNW